MVLLDALNPAILSKELSAFERSAYAFLKNGTAPTQEEFDEWVFSCTFVNSSYDKESSLTCWKTLLSLSLFCLLTHLDRSSITRKILSCEKIVSDETDQYVRSLIALNHVLGGLPIPNVGIHLLESGAALISSRDYCPWLSLPFSPQHFELGIFLSLLNLLNDTEVDLRESVLKIARWQMNTLDHSCKPQSGLFVREIEGDVINQLWTSYLLFRCAALFDPDSSFLKMSHRSFEELKQHFQKQDSAAPILWLLIDKWLDGHKTQSRGHLFQLNRDDLVTKAMNVAHSESDSQREPLPPEREFSLQENIYDPSTALVGVRYPDREVICTLHGVQTGLGTLRQKDVSIVTYGPHYYPLSDCQRFGIQGNALTDNGIRRSQIEMQNQSFSIQGCVRLLDEPSTDESCLGKFRGIWIDISQTLESSIFSVKASFLCLDPIEGVAFTFFIKALKYSVHSRTYSKGKLEKYEGENAPILFEGKTGCVNLKALNYEGKIEVIPLAGEHNFWEADFLVSYPIKDLQKQIEWQIEL